MIRKLVIACATTVSINALVGCVTSHDLLVSHPDVVADAATSDAFSLRTWSNVTPPGIHLSPTAEGDNFGVQDVVLDPARASDFYAFTCHQGVWKSTDYGQTWNGPINTGNNGSLLTGKLWCGAIANASATTPPTLWTCNAYGPANGVWKSTDGGVSWTNYATLPVALGQDVESIEVDPHDANHLLAGFSRSTGVAESTDGAQTWTDVSGNLNPMGESYHPFFLDTAAGDPTVTRSTWLVIADSGTQGGTARTTNGGATWNVVESVEHALGGSQIYQMNGEILIAGSAGSHGDGMYRSTDLGATWAYRGNFGGSVVWGTPRAVYVMYGWPSMTTVDPNFATASQPDANDWMNIATPASLTNGPKRVAITFDGTNYVFVGGMWQAGIWRYIDAP